MLNRLESLKVPKENILNHTKPSRSTLQDMLNQPYLPPSMVFEKQIEKPKPLPKLQTYAPAKILVC
jgi:hypothetical protein